MAPPSPPFLLFPAPLALSLPASALPPLLEACAPPLLPLASLPPLSLARALFTSPFDPSLDLLLRLSTPAAARSLRDAGAALSPPLHFDASLPPPHLAAAVVTGLAARDPDRRLRAALRRALLAQAELEPPLFDHESLALSPRRARADAAIDATLHAFLADLSPSWSDVWHVEDDPTGLHAIALLSRGEPDLAVAVDAAGAPLATVQRHLRFDVLLVDVPAGRLAIRTHHPHDVPALRAVAGRAFFDAPAFFSDRPAFTSRPIQTLGAAGLATARLPAPLTRVRVIACTLEVIGEGRQRATGPAALALLEQAGSPGGYLSELTLRFDVAGEEMPVNVEVRLPGRFACSAPRWRGLVREAMEGLGMMTPGALGDDAWSLFPVRRPDWRLREALGTEAVDALVSRKVLKRVVSRNVTRQELRAQGSNVLTFAVPGEPGVSYAVSSDPSAPPRDVSDRDREVLALDPAKLAALRGKEMKLEGKARARGDGSTLVHGTLRARETTLTFVSVLRAPAGPQEREAMTRELATELFPSHVVLLVPRGRAWGSGLFEVEYTGLVEGGTALVAEAVKRARLEEQVDLWRLTDAPLVVHRKTRRVWFLETPMELADSGYAMIEGLALRAGEIAGVREVCKWISPAREDLRAAKATRPKVVKWMEASLEAAGKKVPREEIERVIVVEGKRGYRLGVGVTVF